MRVCVCVCVSVCVSGLAPMCVCFLPTAVSAEYPWDCVLECLLRQLGNIHSRYNHVSGGEVLHGILRHARSLALWSLISGLGTCHQSPLLPPENIWPRPGAKVPSEKRSGLSWVVSCGPQKRCSKLEEKWRARPSLSRERGKDKPGSTHRRGRSGL